MGKKTEDVTTRKSMLDFDNIFPCLIRNNHEDYLPDDVSIIIARNKKIKEYTTINYKFVRYADDIAIFCNSEEEAKNAIMWTEQYLGTDLRLEMNMKKTKVSNPETIEFLGYSFVKRNDEYIPKIPDKAIRKMYERITKSLRRGSQDDKTWFDRIGAFNRGWINYYRLADYNQMRRIVCEAEYRQAYEMLQSVRNAKINGVQSHDFLSVCESKGFIMMTEWLDELRRRDKVLITE